MSRESTRQGVRFESGFRKPVEVEFDAESLSSDGGVVLLSALDRGMGLSAALMGEVEDRRDPTRIAHRHEELFIQRCLGIVQAYLDGNDAARLSKDPVLKLAVDRDPCDGSDLASQPTLSRFENSVTAREAVKVGRKLEQTVLSRLQRRHRRSRVVTLDLDSTVDPTHGQQQLTFFHGFYDSWCYLPLLAFLSFDDHLEQYLFFARLRPGNSRDLRGVIPLLRRTVPELRCRFPKARIRVRADAGFYHPLLLDVLEELGVQYFVAMPSNEALRRLSHPYLIFARVLGEHHGTTQTLYGETRYRASSWSRKRRVVFKAEVLHYPGRPVRANERYVVTNCLRSSPETIYTLYCQRGDSENRIKELKLDLGIDRTSCSRFVANQFRVLTTAAAYVLLQELRWRLRHTRAARWSVGRLRDALLKVAVRVCRSVRRIACHLSRDLPYRDLWRQAALACGATPR